MDLQGESENSIRAGDSFVPMEVGQQCMKGGAGGAVTGTPPPYCGEGQSLITRLMFIHHVSIWEEVLVE